MNTARTGLNQRIIEFLKPSVIKLIFITEWVLLVLFELLRGELSWRRLPVAFLPMASFYLLGSCLSALSRRTQMVARGSKLILISLSLTFLDQAIKTAVDVFIPYQISVPLIDGWLYLAHERNLRGSWLVETFNLDFVSIAALAVLTVAFLLAALIYYRRYLTNYRSSLWADVAFMGFFAALLSWLLDMLWRGYTLDYIQVPGIVTADLKDVLLTISIASIFAEVYDNPELSFLHQRD